MSEPLSAYMTISQAAKALDMKPRAVRRAIEEERLPATRFGEQWVVLRDDVEAYQKGARRPRKGKQARP